MDRDRLEREAWQAGVVVMLVVGKLKWAWAAASIPFADEWAAIDEEVQQQLTMRFVLVKVRLLIAEWAFESW